MSKVGGNQHLVRKTNLKLIIDMVKKRGPISRAELAKSLKLSAPSVSSNIDQLLELDLLKEVGEGDSIGGRKPILLEFNKSYGCVIGIDLSSRWCKVALGNLLGDIISLEQFNLPADKDGQKIVMEVIETINKIFIKYPSYQDKLMAIAVGTPGVVDPETNQIKLSPQFRGWDHIPIVDILKQNFNVPVLLKNDINLAALGEAYYGCGVQSSNQAYISVDIGIGAGIILKGKLYEGSNLAAGEIGYLIPSPELLEDDFSEYGPLESRASVSSILEQFKTALKSGRASVLHDLVDDSENITLENVKQALDQEDALAQEIIASVAKLLVVAIANLQAILNLDLIILGGEIRLIGNHLLQIIDFYADRVIPIKPKLVFSQLESKAGTYGAFAVALDYVFKNLID